MEFRYTGVKLYRGFVISGFSHCPIQPLFCRCNSRVVAIYDFNNKAVVYSKYSLHFFFRIIEGEVFLVWDGGNKMKSQRDLAKGAKLGVKDDVRILDYYRFI